MRRRRAREYALQFLYGLDFSPVDCVTIEDKLTLFWENCKEGRDDVKSFSEQIIRGTVEDLKDIDILIQGAAQKWSIDRMANIDRTILRMATFEILRHPEIESAVIIDEALEIAKKYSTAESAPFINGILDRIARESRKAVPLGGSPVN